MSSTHSSLLSQIFTRNMLLCIFTGFTSGLPLFVLFQLVPAWLSSNQVDVKTIGFFTLIGFPYTWKFMISPLLDRYYPNFLGRRRSWMLLTQLALLVALISLGQFHPILHIQTVALISSAIAVFSAVQDIVIDAYRREILTDAELGLGNSIHVNAYRIAGLIPGGLSLILADSMMLKQGMYVIYITVLFSGNLMTYKAPFQPSLDNMDVRQDATLDDFAGAGYSTILTAIDALCQGKLSELFIIGDEGVGKTHLAIATLNHYSVQNPNVVCLSLSEVINSGDDIMILMGLETFDLIILDDIQAVCGHDEWEEGLFHLINRIREQQKNLIFIADNPSIDLNIRLPDLKTRLSTSPAMRLPTGDDIDDRTALIRAILRRKNWRLPDEILNYLILEGPQNAKDIVHVLDRVSPLLTHLSRVQVPKKIIEEAKQIISHETLSLEITHYTQ